VHRLPAPAAPAAPGQAGRDRPLPAVRRPRGAGGAARLQGHRLHPGVPQVQPGAAAAEGRRGLPRPDRPGHRLRGEGGRAQREREGADRHQPQDRPGGPRPQGRPAGAGQRRRRAHRPAAEVLPRGAARLRRHQPRRPRRLLVLRQGPPARLEGAGEQPADRLRLPQGAGEAVLPGLPRPPDGGLQPRTGHRDRRPLPAHPGLLRPGVPGPAERPRPHRLPGALPGRVAQQAEGPRRQQGAGAGRRDHPQDQARERGHRTPHPDGLGGAAAGHRGPGGERARRRDRVLAPRNPARHVAEDPSARPAQRRPGARVRDALDGREPDGIGHRPRLPAARCGQPLRRRGRDLPDLRLLEPHPDRRRAGLPPRRPPAGRGEAMSRITERDFVLTCVRLTGFAEYDLYGTGMAGLYLSTARDQVGEERFDAFWAALKKALDGPQGLKALSPTHLEVARALTYLWYTGAWPKLAPAAHAELRREKANTEFVAAPAAYTEGLVWRTFHGHPAGAKAPGFGTWAVPPPGIPPLEELQEETAAGPDGAYRVGM